MTIHLRWGSHKCDGQGLIKIWANDKQNKSEQLKRVVLKALHQLKCFTVKENACNGS